MGLSNTNVAACLGPVCGSRGNPPAWTASLVVSNNGLTAGRCRLPTGLEVDGGFAESFRIVLASDQHGDAVDPCDADLTPLVVRHSYDHRMLTVPFICGQDSQSHVPHGVVTDRAQ